MVFRRLDSRSTAVAINAIGFGGWLGRIEAGLTIVNSCVWQWKVVVLDLCELTWMRFLPSGLVTRGWSLGVVKV